MVLLKLKGKIDRSFEVCTEAGYKHQITKTVTPCPFELASYLWVHKRDNYDFVPETSDEKEVFSDYPKPLLEEVPVKAKPVVKEVPKDILPKSKKKKRRKKISRELEE